MEEAMLRIDRCRQGSVLLGECILLSNFSRFVLFLTQFFMPGNYTHAYYGLSLSLHDWLVGRQIRLLRPQTCPFSCSTWHVSDGRCLSHVRLVGTRVLSQVLKTFSAALSTFTMSSAIGSCSLDPFWMAS